MRNFFRVGGAVRLTGLEGAGTLKFCLWFEKKKKGKKENKREKLKERKIVILF